ncbi:MAG: SDR family oxidoreductase [Mesorhizobium sp.]
MQIDASDTVLITGGASGIGLGMAEAFGAAGLQVVIADINEAALGEADAHLQRQGISARSVILDVSDQKSWESAKDAISDIGPINILCNNAGVAQSRLSFNESLKISEIPASLWQMMMDVNVNGVFFGLKTFLPPMLAEGRGHIVNTTSIAGLFASGSVSAYTASKFAATGLSEAVAAEIAPHGIGMSILCPGGVQSNLVANTASMRARLPGADTGKAKDLISAPLPHAPKMSPRMVGERVLQAIKDNELFVITHPEYRPRVEERFAAVLASFRQTAQSGYSDTEAMLQRACNGVYLDQAARFSGKIAR